MRLILLAVAIGIAFAGSALAEENVRGGRAEDNVRQVQQKLHDDGFYSGEIDGTYSSDLSAALSRYQIRNGLPITGQLDVETSDALGAKPGVGPSTAGTEQSSETWRQLRKGERRRSASAASPEAASTDARETSSPRSDEELQSATGKSPLQTTPASAPAVTENVESRPAPAATVTDAFSIERLRDYVAAYVLAGLDKNVGAETEFFADRVDYYDSGAMNHERIREDLKRYDQRWPERHFWVAGAINVEPQSDSRVRVTFPLGFKLRNGNKHSSGKVDKTLVLERAGEDFQIVAVHERKAE